MGNRLSKLATKTGDKGTTGIAGNVRLDKDAPRIEAIGTIDELNSVIGMVIAHEVSSGIAGQLEQIQQRLFDLGGELAMPGFELVKEEHLQQLDDWLEQGNEKLPPLKEFVLPKGDIATTTCHLARTVCRRAERRVVTLSKTDDINPTGQIFLNRLSDLLFVYCRLLAKSTDQEETLWQSARTRNED